MAELKPCPFCGSKDLWVQKNAWPKYVQCLDCRAEVRTHLIGDEGVMAVIEKWNRRADDENG